MLSWLTTRMARAVALVGAVLLFIVTFGASRKREGRREAENDAIKNTQKRVKAGRDRLRDNRDKSPSDRLRDNDRHW